MKAVAFAYHRPRSISDALALLDDGSSKLVSGAQSLGPMLNMRLVQPAALVDITRVQELGMARDEPTVVKLGACITHAAIEDGRVPDIGGQVLQRIARGIAHRAVRTRGTIGGSLAHCDPAADWVSLLIALDAEVEIQGPDGSRISSMRDFVRGPLLTNLQPNEVLTAVHISKLGARKVGYAKICRKTGELANAIGVAMHEGTNDWRLVAGATSDVPIVITGIAAADLRESSRDSALRERLAASASGWDAYEMNVHVAALSRAIDEVM